MDFIAVVGGMPSPRKVFVLLLLSMIVLSLRTQAQYAGQVTVLDSSGPWIFLCTATPPAGGGGTFYFDLPELEPDGIADPDFSNSDHCDDGCSWEWDISDGAVKGLLVTLPSSATGMGQVATVEGWPIIDNIDLKMAGTGQSHFEEGLRLLVGLGSVTMQFDQLPPQVLELVVTDLQGRFHYKGRVDTVEKQHLELPLPPGVYVIKVQMRGSSLFRKVWVH